MPAASVPSAAASSRSSNGSQCIQTQPSFGSQLCGAPRGARESVAPAGAAGAVSAATATIRQSADRHAWARELDVRGGVGQAIYDA